MSSDIYVDGKPVIQGHTLEIDDDASIGEDLTVGDDATIADELTMTTGGPITTGTNTDLLLVPNGTGITKIGDAGACALGTPLNDDLFVSGREQVLGTSYVGNLSNTEWMSESHDGDDAIYGVGHGGHVFKTDAQKARGTITMGGLPVADEEFIIDTQTFVWKADGSGNVNHVTIGGTAAACVTNLVATFAECTNHAAFTAWDGALDTVVVEWGTAGVVGNAIASTEACTNMIWDAVTLGTTHAGVAAATLLTVTESGFATLGGALSTGGGIAAGGAVSVPSGYAFHHSAASYGSFIGREFHQTVDAAFLTTGTVGNYILLCEDADKAFDFAHTQQPNPTTYLHSANQSTTEWVSDAHNQTDAVKGIGSGSHVTHHAAPTEIADEAEFDLPANSAGWGHVLVGDAEEYAHFVWGSDEVVDLISNSANVVTTDTNTKFCIFDNTGKVSIKNRLGAAKKVMFDYHYTTP